MKRLILLPFLALATLAFAQTNVSLKINHFLGAQPFALQTGAVNNLGNDFNVSRLQYYISSIELVHDGGTITPVTDKYMLVNANDSTYELLGSFNITNLEAIRFGIGVDAANNHADPAAFPANHPLAPKSPSMHWGWAAGYRFIAFEGKGGSSYSYIFELHALDDANYFIQTIPTAGIANGNNLLIELNGDYTRILEDIFVNNGVVVHGSTGEAKTALQNFAYYVFTSSEGNSAMSTEDELQTSTRITIAPNPVSRAQKVYVDKLPAGAQVILTDITGKQLDIMVENSHFAVSHLPAGLYLVRVMKNDKQLAIQKIVVQ